MTAMNETTVIRIPVTLPYPDFDTKVKNMVRAVQPNSSIRAIESSVGTYGVYRAGELNSIVELSRTPTKFILNIRSKENLGLSLKNRFMPIRGTSSKRTVKVK